MCGILFLMIHRRSFPPAAFAVALSLLAGPRCLADPIQDIVNAVSQSSYTNYLNTSLFTETGDNRGLTGTDHDPARTNIYDTFVSFGLTTTLAAFTYSGATYYNVVATLMGSDRPTDYYIVGAHYDSVNNPGADDDASGVAAVLEAARVLSQYSFEASILFIAFDREEQGLIGSAAWAATHSSWDILGMISLDMIAYNPSGSKHDGASIYQAVAGDNTAALDLAAAVTAYSGGLTPTIAGTSSRSDHYPFGALDFPAALLIEASWGNNPNYHKAADSVNTAGYIDYEFATRMTRSAVGYLATEADYVPEPAALLLVASGLIFLAVAFRRRHRQAQHPAAFSGSSCIGQV